MLAFVNLERDSENTTSKQAMPPSAMKYLVFFIILNSQIKRVTIRMSYFFEGFFLHTFMRDLQQTKNGVG